jgi:putative NADH-flavin reductase
MTKNNTIALLGGGGRTGKYIVEELLRKGYQIKLLLRGPEKFQIESPLIKIYKGMPLMRRQLVY